MHRCRDIGSDHAQLAMGLSPDATRVRLRDLHGHKLVSVVRPKATQGSGRRPYQFALTQTGYDILIEHLAAEHGRDEDEIIAEIGAWCPPLKRVWSQIKFTHRSRTVDAIIAAENSIHERDGYRIKRAVPEFRRDEFDGTAHPTADMIPNSDIRLKFDAIVIVEGSIGSGLIAVEIDTGSMNLRQLDEKFRKHWAYLRSGRCCDRFKVSESLFQTCFVTTTRARISQIKNGIAWDTYPPISGADPSDLLYLTTHEDMKKDFFGVHCELPGISGRFGLLDSDAEAIRAA